MKKLIVLTLFSIALIYAKAQLFTIGNTQIGFLYLGPKAGISGSWVTNTTATGNDTKIFMGYQYGVVGKFGITQALAIQPEFLYSRKGSRQTFDGGETKTIASYLGIPILAKFSFVKIGNMRFHGSGGIYNNITLSSKRQYKFDNGFEEESVLNSTDYKRVDFGLSLGGGIEYELDYGLIIGELLIEQGTIDMYEDNVIQDSNRNTTVTLAFTYLFDFVDISAKIFRKSMENK